MIRQNSKVKTTIDLPALVAFGIFVNVQRFYMLDVLHSEKIMLQSKKMIACNTKSSKQL